MQDLLVSRMAGGPEIFASIQGEGASIGYSSTFVRLAVCNLRCTWCDTAYTWDWSRYNRAEQVLPMSPEAVFGAVRALPPRRVVITGGEPLLSKNTFKVLDYLIDNPQPHMEFNINSNLGVPKDILDKFIEKISIIQDMKAV